MSDVAAGKRRREDGDDASEDDDDDDDGPEPPLAASQRLRSLRYDSSGPSLQVLDQLLLPARKEYVPVRSVEEAWAVIRSMQIRGAPLIAIVACLGLAVDLARPEAEAAALAVVTGNDSDDAPAAAAAAAADALLAHWQGKMEYLATSRPTAVNLFHALAELRAALTTEAEAAAAETGEPASPAALYGRLRRATQAYAEALMARDERDNVAISRRGARLVWREARRRRRQRENGAAGGNDNGDDSPQVRVMTICNTGSLATSAVGTALGVVRALHARGRLAEAVALETRPYNQGARLTAVELVEDRLPGRLICDGMAGAFLRAHPVDAVVVGADRVCANGDTANKVGTYGLALLAAAHGVPFYVAAPLTTLDADVPDGDAVEIEQRPAEELLRTSQAPDGVAVWNPGFDVTPARYIHGIITERGVIGPDSATGTFDVAGFVRQHTDATTD